MYPEVSHNTKTSINKPPFTLGWYVCIFLLFLSIGAYRNSGNMEGIIWSDTEGYYLYLPVLFGPGDFHHLPTRSVDFQKNEKGEPYNKYTCGLAYFYLPFYLTAHGLSLAFNWDTSGYAPAYYWAVLVCGVFWFTVWVWLISTLLSRFFRQRVVQITLACLVLGTNLFYYATREVAMSHLYSLVLVTAILLIVVTYYRKQTAAKAVAIGLMAGLLLLVRPTNIAVLLYVFMFGIVTFADLWARTRLFITHVAHVFIAMGAAVLPCLPQLFYWKAISGHWVMYSYNNEKFVYFAHPKVAEVLFDPQNGLFLYAPILLLTIPAAIVWRKDTRSSAIGLLLTFGLITYVFASWWAWWFGAAFGHRCYIEYLPILAFPLALFYEWVLQHPKKRIRIAVLCTTVLFLYYTTSLSFVYDQTRFWDGAGWHWNWDAWLGETKRAFHLR